MAGGLGVLPPFQVAAEAACFDQPVYPVGLLTNLPISCYTFLQSTKHERMHQLTRQHLSDQERFFSHVNFNGPVPPNHPELGPCWLWTGKPLSTGYGRIMLGGKTHTAHRYSYELAYGLTSRHLHHICETPLCVRPTHIAPLTHSDHTRVHKTGNRKVACVNGHIYTPESTWVDSAGWQHCLICRREHDRNYYYQHRTSRISSMKHYQDTHKEQLTEYRKKRKQSKLATGIC